MVQDLMMKAKLRRSAMFAVVSPDKRLHHAPTKLANLSKASIYKHSVPAGPETLTRFLTISSEHFRLTCPADLDRRDANVVLNILESARADLLRRAGNALISVGGIPTLEIRLNNSTGDFTARTAQPWWAAAATRGNKIELQPFGVLKRRGVVATTLRHELAHVFIDMVSNNRAPRWLEEGFALYLAGEGPRISQYQPRGMLPTAELEKRLERPGSPQDMRALYAEAYRAVFYLIRTEGETSVWKKLAAS